MTFGDFCEHLRKIEATPKRLQMTALLSELLKQANPNEVDKVIMLSLGRLAPLYRDIDFGLAEKTMIRAIALANDVGAKDVVREFKKSGDLGETAMALKIRNHKSDIRNHKAKTSVSDTYDSLLAIARESGEGSQEKKVNKTADLLRELDPLGAKYAVRIILGNLRLGFSDKTVLDALSVMIAGDKSAREKLEAAYNVRPDVGALARQIINHKSDIRNFKVEPELGVPILPALCQRLPAAEEIIEKMRQVAVEPKWDGQRIQAHLGLNSKSEIRNHKSKTSRINLFTRSLENVTEMFPDLVNALSVIPAKAGIYPNNLNRFRLGGRNDKTITSFILDGEVIAVDPKTGRILPFQTMITRKRKYGIAEKLAAVPIKYMVFDILYLNGKSLMEAPFYKRREILEKVFNFQNTRKTQKTRESDKSENQNVGKSGSLAFRFSDVSGSPSILSVLEIAPQLVTSDAAEIRKFLQYQISRGLEGIVAKRSDAPYIPGRTQFAWVKLKWEGSAKSGGLLDTVDCVVMGTYAGRGKRSSFGAGAFLVGVADQEKSDIRNHKSYFQSIYKTISKIGTGLTDEQWRELKAEGRRLKAEGKPKEYDVPKELTPDIWLKPKLVVEIQADNITKSPLHTAGFALRFPRLVRYRTDKRADQVTTVEEVKKLYEISLRKPRLPPR